MRSGSSAVSKCATPPGRLVHAELWLEIESADTSEVTTRTGAARTQCTHVHLTRTPTRTTAAPEPRGPRSSRLSRTRRMARAAIWPVTRSGFSGASAPIGRGGRRYCGRVQGAECRVQSAVLSAGCRVPGACAGCRVLCLLPAALCLMCSAPGHDRGRRRACRGRDDRRGDRASCRVHASVRADRSFGASVAAMIRGSSRVSKAYDKHRPRCLAGQTLSPVGWQEAEQQLGLRADSLGPEPAESGERRISAAGVDRPQSETPGREIGGTGAGHGGRGRAAG